MYTIEEQIQRASDNPRISTRSFERIHKVKIEIFYLFSSLQNYTKPPTATIKIPDEIEK